MNAHASRTPAAELAVPPTAGQLTSPTLAHERPRQSDTRRPLGWPHPACTRLIALGACCHALMVFAMWALGWPHPACTRLIALGACCHALMVFAMWALGWPPRPSVNDGTLPGGYVRASSGKGLRPSGPARPSVNDGTLPGGYVRASSGKGLRPSGPARPSVTRADRGSSADPRRSRPFRGWLSCTPGIQHARTAARQPIHDGADRSGAGCPARRASSTRGPRAGHGPNQRPPPGSPRPRLPGALSGVVAGRARSQPKATPGITATPPTGRLIRGRGRPGTVPTESFVPLIGSVPNRDEFGCHPCLTWR